MIRMIIFFSLAGLIIALLHYFIYLRIGRYLSSDPLHLKRIKMGLAAAAISLLTVMPLSRYIPPEIIFLPTYLAYSWLGLIFYLFTFTLLLFIGEGFAITGRKFWSLMAAPPTLIPVNAPKRDFFKKVAATSALSSAAVLTGYGNYSAFYDIIRIDLEIKLRHFPAALNGFKIVQLSDLHVGAVVGGKFLRHIVERVNQIKPDCIVVTGDLVDGSVKLLQHQVAILKNLQAKWGTFFVTGNHEYYSGVAEWLPYLQKMGWTVLQNEFYPLKDFKHEFYLAGVHDYRGHTINPRFAPSIPQALSAIPDGKATILLAHQPIHVLEASSYNIGLQISGHTHGGQIWPFSKLVLFAQPYIKGLHQVNDVTQIYVSCGTGFWGPPMRIGAPGEITVFNLNA